MAASGTRGSIGKASYEAVRKHIDEGKKATEAFRLVAQETGRSTATVQTAYYRVARSLPGGGGVQLRPRKKTAAKRAPAKSTARQARRASRTPAQERSSRLLRGRRGAPAERGRRALVAHVDPSRARARRRPQGQRAPGEDRTRSRSAEAEVRSRVGGAPMRIWIDLSAPAHPVVFRPIVAPAARCGPRGRGDGARLRADARAGARSPVSTPWRSERTAGAPPAASCAAWPGAPTALWRWARTRPRFDLAAAHGSNDLPIVARTLRIPAVDLFDYEWATFQHMIGCRLARRVIVPDAIPPERLKRYGAGPTQAAAVPRAQGGVLPQRLRARPRHPGERRRRSGAHRRRPADAAGRCALPPRRQPGLRRPARPPRPRPGRARRGAPAPARAGRRAAPPRAALGARPRARGRRPEPRLGLRPRDLGRRQHEPRGSRARRPRLHDLPGAHGRRRREAPARGPPAPSRATPPTSNSSAATAQPPACAATPN